ncbi:MAG: hypothetical protein OXU40_06090 [Nitrospira sp.]|nr:hypothetical protein [Nitrospira sp.]
MKLWLAIGIFTGIVWRSFIAVYCITIGDGEARVRKSCGPVWLVDVARSRSGQ